MLAAERGWRSPCTTEGEPVAPQSSLPPEDYLELKAAEAVARATASGATPEIAAVWQRVAHNYRWLAQYQRVFGQSQLSSPWPSGRRRN